jgi:hypothetical protein
MVKDVGKPHGFILLEEEPSTLTLNIFNMKNFCPEARRVCE